MFLIGPTSRMVEEKFRRNLGCERRDAREKTGMRLVFERIQDENVIKIKNTKQSAAKISNFGSEIKILNSISVFGIVNRIFESRIEF